jgi:RNA polymerase sigma-32 factor
VVMRMVVDQPLRLVEVSEVYEVCRERIRMIVVRAFEKLQKRMQDLAREKGMLARA